MKKIILIAGTRPNFMKIAPLLKVFEKEENKKLFDVKLVHTGQHYDQNMSEVFFQELNIRKPDYYLGVGSGSNAEVDAKVMIELEKILINEKPDFVLVVGDVNSTLAASIVAKKQHFKLVHVESGLRSNNRNMIEELNRIVVDHLSDILFVSEETGIKNLKKEGITKDVYFVGNVMIDSLFNSLEKAKTVNTLERYDLKQNEYVLWTMHRPETVDNKELLQIAMNILKDVQKKIKVIWPLHPRTKKRLDEFGIEYKFERVIITEPLGYLDTINLERNAKCIMTDSGGIQEEASAFNVPCLTTRPETERPITVKQGTNTVVNLDKKKILNKLTQISEGNYDKKECKIPLWDGKASERIVEILKNKEYI